MYHSVQAC